MPFPRSTAELQLAHRLWLHRRLARGLAHEIANVQQMLLLPDPPPEMRDELDARLGLVAEALSRTAREDDAAVVAERCDPELALLEAARTHDRLGGEPRVRWTVAVEPGAPAPRAHPLALHRALVTMLVLAGRALDRTARAPAAFRAGGGDTSEIEVSVASRGEPPGEEDLWLEACARSWLETAGGTLAVRRGEGRATVSARLPVDSSS